MANFEHTYEIQVLECHLDSFGHVNHAVYLNLMEEARWDLITSRGFGLKKVQEMQLGPVILDVHIAYKKELRLREKINIVSKTMSYKHKISKFQQSIYIKPDSLSSRATFTFGLFDMKQRRLVHPTPEWLYAIGHAKEVSGKL